jgi:hypothetical protein
MDFGLSYHLKKVFTIRIKGHHLYLSDINFEKIKLKKNSEMSLQQSYHYIAVWYSVKVFVFVFCPGISYC